MTAGINNDLLSNLTSALEDEIAAACLLKTSYTLGVGFRLDSSARGYAYRFSVVNPPPLQDDTRGRITINGAGIECAVRSIEVDGLIVETEVDLGESVGAAVLEVDRSQILSVLLGRFQDLLSGAQAFPFNHRMAHLALFPSKAPPDGNNFFMHGAEELAEDQKEAVRRCLNNQVTFLWGPPGTGKTTTLTTVAWNLFRENKRVLVIAHTNRAIDRFIEELWKRVLGKSRGSIPEGSIVRVGATDGLDASIAANVGLGAAASSLRAKANERVESVRRELGIIDREVSDLEEKLGLVARLKVLQGELADLQQMILPVKQGEGRLSTVLRVLKVRYGSVGESDDSLGALKESIKTISREILEATTALDGLSVDDVENQILEARSRERGLRESLVDLEDLLSSAEEEALSRARSVACTASQAIFRCRSLGDFDVVIIDEASMLPLPVALFITGLANERVIIGGDFRQLPPIVLSDTPAVREWFARDIFEAAGIVDAVESDHESPCLAVLRTQFRGHPRISRLLNDLFYGGLLLPDMDVAPEGGGPNGLSWIDSGPIILVDTGPLWPAGFTESGSKANLVNALTVKTICRYLQLPRSYPDELSVGVISPYRRQVSLIEELFAEAGISSSVGTVHRFQGAERDIIILDLTESAPHKVGAFLSSESLREPGSRLLNVGLSRARSKLFIVADLGYLKRNLSEKSVLAAVVREAEVIARPVEAQQVFLSVDSSPSAPVGSSQIQNFDKEGFLAGLSADLLGAKESVLVRASLLGTRSAHVFATLCKPLISKGGACRVFLGAKSSSGTDISANDSILESGGIEVHPALPHVPECIVVDEEVVWLITGSPLDAVERESLTGIRFVSRVAAKTILRLMPSAGNTVIEEKRVGNS